MRRRRLASAAALALMIAPALAWYVGSPLWTLSRMREAAQRGDWPALTSYVDRPALHQAWVAAASEIRRTPETEEDAKTMLGEGWPEILKETYEAVPYRPREFLAGSLGLPSRLTRHGLNEFTIRSPSTPSPGTFVFRRHGLGWKLSEVRWGWPEEPRR